MTTRPYKLGRRQLQADRTRTRLVTSARRLLMSKRGLDDFSVDAVARYAGVTRLTIYHQFGSKVDLLEALYDDIARRGKIGPRLAAAFQRTDPVACLDGVADAFVQFWHSQRLLLRRLRSMAVLDPSFKRGRERDQWRRKAVQTAVSRLPAATMSAPPGSEELVNVISMITSFETYDALAGANPDLEKIKKLVRALVSAVLRDMGA